MPHFSMPPAQRRRTGAAALLALTVALPGLAAAQGEPSSDAGDHAGRNGHVLYVESNVTQAGQNSILAYRIDPDGSLRPLIGSPFLTGGTGYYDSSFKLGPFDNDQNVILNGARSILYAVNGGSNTIAALRLDRDGRPTPLPGSPFAAGGSTPVSLGLHRDTLVAVDSAEDPAQATADGGKPRLPKVSVSRVGFDGRLALEPYASLTLPTGSNPTQALTTSTGSFVFSAEFPGGGNLLSFYQTPDGRLIPADKVALPLVNETQALPLGLWGIPRLPTSTWVFQTPIPTSTRWASTPGTRQASSGSSAW